MIHTFLAENDPVQNVFGPGISPPSGMYNPGENPISTISNLLVKGIQLFILVAGLIMLFFLLWGALDWIISGGDKDKVAKAQSKITNSIVGFVVLFVVLGGFGLITGDILGIMHRASDGSWIFNLPTLGNSNP